MKKIVHAFLFPAIVFVTGACVLVVELTGLRLLAPYFGNTIYTATSVITVVLLALSLGYYIGGRYADTHLQERYFFRLIFVSGIGVVCIPLFLLGFVFFLARDLSLLTGSLLGSLLLFLIPSIFLGMLSPYAIALQKKRLPEQGIGRTSGVIFFWSTAGSIMGSLLTGFYLIPTFDTYGIMYVVGMILMVLGLFGFLQSKKSAIVAASCFVVIGSTMALVSPPVYAQTVYNKQGLYSNIHVFDQEYEGKMTRFLQLNTNASSAQYHDSDEPVFSYAQFYKLSDFSPYHNEILVLGGGAYTLPFLYSNAYPEAEITTVEIDPALYEIAQEYFRLEDTVTTNVVEDARRYLVKNEKMYDVIFVDAFNSLYGIPSHLVTKEFFQEVSGSLNDGGVSIINLIGDLHTDDVNFVPSVVKTLQEVFPYTQLFLSKTSSTQEIQNIIVLVANEEQSMDELELNDKDFAVFAKEHMVNMQELDLRNQQVFTDRYAPAEYLTLQLLKRKGL